MKTKYTKGEWKVDEKRNLATNEFSLFAGKKYIGRFTLAAPYPLGKEATDEMYANAKLIASAPELLEALSKTNEVLRWAIDEGLLKEEQFESINKRNIKAIEKATE